MKSKLKHREKYTTREDGAEWLREMAKIVAEGAAEYVWIQVDVRHASKNEIEERQHEPRRQAANQ